MSQTLKRKFKCNFTDSQKVWLNRQFNTEAIQKTLKSKHLKSNKPTVLNDCPQQPAASAFALLEGHGVDDLLDAQHHPAVGAHEVAVLLLDRLGIHALAFRHCVCGCVCVKRAIYNT